MEGNQSTSSEMTTSFATETRPRAELHAGTSQQYFVYLGSWNETCVVIVIITPGV